MNGDPRTRSGLGWSSKWKELVMNLNDVKPFCEVIKIETEFLTSIVCGAGVFNFFQKYQI